MFDHNLKNVNKKSSNLLDGVIDTAVIQHSKSTEFISVNKFNEGNANSSFDSQDELNSFDLKKNKKERQSLVNLSIDSEDNKIILSESDLQKSDLQNKSKKNYKFRFANLNDSFEVFTDFNINTRKQSESFNYLRKTINQSDELIEKLESGEGFELSDENYTQFLRLYEACDQYVTHNKSSGNTLDMQRLNAARDIRHRLDQVAGYIVASDGAVVYDDENMLPSRQETAFARDNVRRFSKYFREFCKRIDDDFVADDEEKIRKKWNVIKTCERDIKIFAESTDNPTGEDYFIIEQYKSLRLQMMLRDKAKNEGLTEAFENETTGLIERHAEEIAQIGEGQAQRARVREDSMTEKDNLTDRQVRALSRIDTWITRNFRNGGWFRVMADRTDIINRLFSMSRRKRLFAYYLVQTDQRKEPTIDSFINSQNFTLDVDEFKKKMIPTKLKFYKRFSGEYIYWSKLTDSMNIVNQVDHIRVPQPLEDDDAVPLNKDGSEVQDEDLLEKTSKSYAETKATVKAFAGTTPTNLSSLTTIVKNGMTDEHTVSLFKMNDADVKSLGLITGGAGAGLATIGTVVNGVVTAMNLYNSGKSMSGLEITASTGGILVGAGATAQKLTNFISGVGDFTNSAVKIVTGQAAVVGVVGASAAITGLQIGTNIRNGYHRLNAVAIAKMKRRGGAQLDKFEKGILEMNVELGNKELTTSVTSGMSTALTATAGILFAASVVTCGISALAGVAALALSVGSMAIEQSFSGKMKDALFDSYYEVDRAFDTAKQRVEQKSGRLLTDKEQVKLRQEVRNRIASRLGFYSPHHAARAAAVKYAEYLLDKANQVGPEGILGIEMIKGLGLSYNAAKNVPTASDIVRKLCG
ncbi:MAG: hypothetical protein IJ695_06945 [Butyrivibrio sp.]|nr:hypothetical protein [Butyrivibrio sp.]